VFESTIVPTITPCSLGRFIAELDEDSRVNLAKALAMNNLDVSHRRISRDIREEANVTIDPETIAAHRNGNCRCSKI